MNARVSISDIARVVLPRECKNGWLAMLSAYFDDSGTHDSSKVVVVGGIMGTESELLSLESMWRFHLNRPLDGLKPPIREFHAYDCFHSKGEFEGWSRTETDFFRHQLREVIIKSHVSGYGFACVREEWDAEIQGTLRDINGDSEGYAIRSCFVRALRWAQMATFDPDISFIFDYRQQSERDTRAVFDAFKEHWRDKNIVGIYFLDSTKILPLQAADLFAWEFNRNAHKILLHGMNTPSTKEMLHLAKGLEYIDAQIARRDKIALLKKYAIGDHSSDLLDAMARHFRDFGRDASSKSSRRKRK